MVWGCIEVGGAWFSTGYLPEEVEDAAEAVLVLDEELEDPIAEYQFLGREVFSERVSESVADFVSAATIYSLVSGGVAVICGGSAGACWMAMVAYGVKRGLSLRASLNEAEANLRRLYGRPARPSYPQALALLACVDAAEVLGEGLLGSLLWLASRYGYGLGEGHYGQVASYAFLASKLFGLDARRTYLLSLLHFACEAPGGDAFELRSEALEPPLRSILGDETRPLLRSLARIAGLRPASREEAAVALLHHATPAAPSATRPVMLKGGVLHLPLDHEELPEVAVRAVTEASKLLGVRVSFEAPQ